MITLDTNAGVASDVAMVFRGTEAEPDEDGTNVVVTMTIGEDEDFVLEYLSGPNRVQTQIFIPLDRLKRLIENS